MLVLAIGAIHHWASNNFYLTRIQMLFVCFVAFLLALAAFLVGLFEGEKQNPLPSYIIFHAPCLPSSLAKIVPLLHMTLTFSYICCSDKPFVGASVGYFSFLFLLAGRALTVSYIALFSFKLHIFLFVFGCLISGCSASSSFTLWYNNPFCAGSSFTSDCSLFSKSTACICL
jgi:hypothetical protein